MDQSSRRTPGEGPSPRSPDPDVRAAIQEQWTPTLQRRLRRFVDRRRRSLTAIGRHVTTPTNELMYDAVTDTTCGDLAWDPARRPLYGHLCAVIRQRTWDESERNRRFVSIDAINDQHLDDESEPSPEASLVDELLAVKTDFSEAAVICVFRRVCEDLRETAKSDPDCRGIVACWMRALIAHDHVMEATGLSPGDYDRARKRLLYHVRDLRNDLRAHVLEALRRTP